MGRGSEKRQNGATDGVGGGLVAGDEQEHAGSQQLAVAQHLALLFSGDKGADQVFARLAAALFDDSAEVVGQLQGALAGALQHFGGHQGAAGGGRDVGG